MKAHVPSIFAAMAGLAGCLPGLGGDSNGGGGTGGTGGSGVPTACMPGAPSPAAGGAAFPFPQHRLSSMCTYAPACADSDLTTGWPKYKTRMIVDGGSGAGSLRVQRPENANDTVSEGIGYGMLLAVYMADKATFDGLWQYAQAHFDGSGLMNWNISATGATLGSNSATDADEDIAFALVMADKQWSGYTATAQAFVGKVLSHDFNSGDGSIKGGDANNFNDVNPSYLAPAYYKIFQTYTGNAQWATIVNRSYALLAAATNATTGLVPEWSSGNHGTDLSQYKYNACRTPFRIALDACWFGDQRAKTYVDNVSAFFDNIGALNILDGYQVTGAAIGQFHTAPFFGPAGVGGMAADKPRLVADAYGRVKSTVVAGGENYYNLSWALLSSLVMTGNFVDYTAL